LRAGLIGRIAYLGVDPSPPFALEGGEVYLQILPDNQLPLTELRLRGLLGPHTLAYVATPTALHLHYAELLLPLAGRVTVEKPLTDDPAAAAALEGRARRPVPVCHFLQKRAVRRFLADCRRGAAPDLRGLGGVRVDILESQGTAGRRIDPAEWDLGWHAL